MSVAFAETLTPNRPDVGNPRILVVGTTVVDLNVSFPKGPSEANLPPRIQQLPIDKKVAAKNKDDFRDHQRSLVLSGAHFTESIGGNAYNVGSVANSLTNGEVGVYTWVGTDLNGTLVRRKFDEAGLISIIHQYEGHTPTGLIVPRVTSDGRLDKTTVGYKPAGFPSDFADIVRYHPRLAVVNSLTGEQWPDSLKKGTDLLKKAGILYTDTPGSSQFEAVEQGSDAAPAVYDGIAGAHLLPVNRAELELLLIGKNVTPAEKTSELLKQGVHELGANIVVVTFGPQGAAAADQEGNVIGVSATRVRATRGTNRAGDFFLAGVLAALAESDENIGDSGNIENALRFGSATASFAIESTAADPYPVMGDIIHRLRERPPELLDLAK